MRRAGLRRPLSFAADPVGMTREMGSWSAADLPALPVRLHRVELGRPVDVIVDVDGWRALGIEVRCGDGTHRFLPLAAMQLGDGEISIASAFMLLDEVAFYRARGRPLERLRGGTVTTGAGRLGTLRDMTFGPDGSISELVVSTPGGELRFPPTSDIRVATRRAPAA